MGELPLKGPDFAKLWERYDATRRADASSVLIRMLESWPQPHGLVAATEATTAVMQGREMPGWLRVSPEDLASDDDLSRWVDIGVGHARSLPPKQPAKAKPKK